MKTLSFELTMPNVGSWNGKWTGDNKRYFVIRQVTNDFFKGRIEPLLDGKVFQNFYYNFGDGWGANVHIEIIDSKEGRKRLKNSAGFCGYEWMVNSIMKYGKITTDE